MKKSYLMITVASALLAACSSNDSFKEVVTQDTAIGFSTYTAKQTRAENSTQNATDDLENYNKTFKVWSYKNVYVDSQTSSNDYVFGHIVGQTQTTYPGTVVQHNGTEWAYTPLRFWDKSASYYKFFAASPAKYAWNWSKDNDKLALANFTIKGENRVTDGTGALGVLTYTSNANAPKALLMSDIDDEDLMISTDITDWTNYSGQDVTLQFNHILSRLNIGFRKTTELDDYIVYLNTIEIHNLVKTASFNENTELTKENAGVYGSFGTDATPTAAELLNKGTAARWDAGTTPVRFTSNEMKYLVENNNNEVEPLEIDYTETAGTAKTGYQYVFQGLVIPQVANYTKTVEATSTETDCFKMDGSNASTSANPYIVIDYEIWTKDHSSETYAATDPEVIGGIANEGDSKPASYKLDGYKYFYNLADVFNGNTTGTNNITFCEGWQNTLLITLKPTKISFDAVVYGWADNGEVEVNIEK